MKKHLSLFVIGVIAGMQLAFPQSYRHRTPKGFDNGITEKWELRADIGAQVSDIAGLIDIGVGYNVNENIYLGLASGAYPKYGAAGEIESVTHFPVMADFTYRYNPPTDNWSFFAFFRGGYIMPSKTEAFFKNSKPYERQGYTAFEFGPGYALRLQRNIDLRFSMNYALAIPGDDGFDPAVNHTEHLFQMRVGMAFRGKPKSGTRAEMIAEANRKAEEERRRYDEEWAAKQKAEEEEYRRRTEEEREERRRRREESTQRAVESLSVTANEMPFEFFCHITPDMVENNTIDNKLVQLASMAAGKTVSTIVVLGLAPGTDSADASSIVTAIQNSDKVKNYLYKRYVISRDLVTTFTSGFETNSGKDSRPKEAIATIIIQKKPADK